MQLIHHIFYILHMNNNISSLSSENTEMGACSCSRKGSIQKNKTNVQTDLNYGVCKWQSDPKQNKKKYESFLILSSFLVALEGPAEMVRCIRGQKEVWIFKAKLSVSAQWILRRAKGRTVLVQTPLRSMVFVKRHTPGTHFVIVGACCRLHRLGHLWVHRPAVSST